MIMATEHRVIKGIGASAGMALGTACLITKKDYHVPFHKINDPEKEKQLFIMAYNEIVAETTALAKKAHQSAGEKAAEIFELHHSILSDPEFINPIFTNITSNLMNAALAVEEAGNQLAAVFESMEDSYMRERSADILDLKQRLQRKILRKDFNMDQLDLPVGAIIIAEELTPSDTALIDTEKVGAIITASGGKTSHAAILARMLGIPAVLGIGSEIKNLKQAFSLLVDGQKGNVTINPDKNDIGTFKKHKENTAKSEEELIQYKNIPACTIDGYKITLMANIGTPDDLKYALEAGADGIGLFRSEFLFLDRETAPSESEQYEAYKMVLEGMKGKSVIIRTLDVGGDKSVPFITIPKEENPFLGYRAIRICLDQPEIFDTQLRALLRASLFGELHIMFPMISSLDELLKAKERVHNMAAQLRTEGIEVPKSYKIGMMVETPAAAISASIFAKECDFFSIGTNDLTQYTLAVDRGNATIAPLYSTYHPSVLSLIKTTKEAAKKRGIPCGVCGEAAGDLELLPLLIGLELDELSVNPRSILKMKKEITQMSFSEAERALEQTSSFSTAAQIHSFLKEKKKRREE